MTFEQIQVERDGGDAGVATITLNRPDKLNAYTVRMGVELVDAFRSLRDDPQVRSIILTGAGRGFCAGVDLEALGAMQSGAPSSGPKLGEEEFVRGFAAELLAFPKPVIAAINGAAIGVGVTMVLPCDLRVAADTAKLGLTFAKLGILPGLGSTHLLPRIVGLARAQELVLTARVIQAPEACAIGLVNRVVPGDELLATAREWATSMAACDPDALTFAKRAIQRGATSSMEEAMAHEQQASAELREARAKRRRPS
jgi:2-(1,2-epoxy-1,2-dihydrophenyl)acetyl-CoA isomerase